jgi:hypothetical protein
MRPVIAPRDPAPTLLTPLTCCPKDACVAAVGSWHTANHAGCDHITICSLDTHLHASQLNDKVLLYQAPSCSDPCRITTCVVDSVSAPAVPYTS